MKPQIPQMDIPAKKSDITRDWIAGSLEESFPSVPNKLQGIKVEEIGVGYGLMASLVRCYLSYSEECDGPESVVLKMSSSDPASLKLAKSLDLYKREYDFYVNIQPTAKIRAPKLYHGAIDAGSNLFVLVLEDLCYMKAFNQLEGASREQALIAVSAIGRLHGQFWNRKDSKELNDAYKVITPLNAAVVHFIFRSNVDLAIQKFHQFFSPRLENVVRTFGKRTTELMIMSGSSDVTYIHGDYRLDNMFFDNDELAVLDWQVSGVSGGFFDVAYFLTGSLTPEVRKSVEREAIERYCEVVSAERGSTLSFSDGWDFYRQGVLSCLLTSVIVSGGLDLTVDRSNDLVVAGLKRTLLAIEELDADEFLDVRPNRFSIAVAMNALINVVFGLTRVFRKSK